MHRDSGHLPGCPFGNLIVETATYSPGLREAIKHHLQRIAGHFQHCLQAAAAFDSAQATFGMIPNLTRKMATSPALAQAYLELTDLFEGCSLSAQ